MEFGNIYSMYIFQFSLFSYSSHYLLYVFEPHAYYQDTHCLYPLKLKWILTSSTNYFSVPIMTIAGFVLACHDYGNNNATVARRRSTVVACQRLNCTFASRDLWRHVDVLIACHVTSSTSAPPVRAFRLRVSSWFGYTGGKGVKLR